MLCKKCGNDIPQGKAFCSKCGTPAEQRSEIVEKKPKTSGLKKKPKIKKKELIIDIICAVVIVIVVIAAIVASKSSNTDDNYYDDSDDTVFNDDFVDEQFNDDSLDENDMQDSNDDEFWDDPVDGNEIVDSVDEQIDNNDNNEADEEMIELRNSDAYFINGVCNEYGQKNSEDFFGLAFMNINDNIQLLDRSKTIAIYTAYDSVRFVPVISEAKYTVGYDFEDGIDYDTDHVKVSDFPSIITGGISGIQGQRSPYSSYGFSELIRPGNPIQECNGMALEDFMAENSKEYFSSGYSYYPKLYIVAKPNETFTFGGYIGTEWVEEELKADVEYYEIDGAITIVPEKTKKGYFTLDCSGFDTGLYYVIEFDTFVEIV